MTTRVEVHGWQRYVLVSVLVMEVVLITEDTGVWLVCNPPQSQDTSTQTDVNENRAVLGSLLSLGLPERRLETTNREVIPLMPRSSGSGWATREMGVTFTIVRESPPPTPREAYLPQRPERMQKREASEMRLTHPLASQRARKTKQNPR